MSPADEAIANKKSQKNISPDNIKHKRKMKDGAETSSPPKKLSLKIKMETTGEHSGLSSDLKYQKDLTIGQLPSDLFTLSGPTFSNSTIKVN